MGAALQNKAGNRGDNRSETEIEADRERFFRAIAGRAWLAAAAALLIYAVFNPKGLARGMEVLGNGVRYGAFETSLIVLNPAIKGEPGLHIIDKARAANGYRMALGYSPELSGFSVQLFAPEGSKLKEILISLEALNASKDAFNHYPHAFHPLSDGSVIVNSDDGKVMARIGYCGQTIWSRPGAFHHSLASADDGTLWTWLGDQNAYSARQSMVRIDPETGETLQEIRLVEDVLSVASAEDRLRFGLGANAALAGDPFHPNDIEPLPARMAHAWPQFPVGALLVSFRSPNLLAIIDPDTYEILWAQNGPWLKQHDPDWTEAGEILLMNNNVLGEGETPDTNWQRAARSNVLAVSFEPEGAVLQARPTPPFATNIQGKIELLPNGNLLVLSAEQGRAFEVDAQGNLAADFHNRAHKGWYGRVTDAKFLALDFFTFDPANTPCKRG